MKKTFKIDESSVYGRNEDKEILVKRLLANGNGNASLEVISIVGIGGMGKTFLTKLVYMDDKVEDWFDVKIWVCAATKFDIVDKLAKEILEEVTCDANNITSTTTTSDHVLLELKEKLSGKKFLLILDDVWNDNKAEWSFLLAHLESGARGSKIIVTTRNQSVASALGSVESHVLNELSDDHCWNLFAKHAFSDYEHRLISPNDHQGLEKIGKEIVKKCQGLPLVAIMVGEFLCSVKDAEEWERVLNNMEMEVCSNYNIFMILKLSHVDLLFHLKQCLAFCIKSPKDYEFVKKKLLLSCFEQNLITSKENKEEGDRYFHELELRHFIVRGLDVVDLTLSVSQKLFQWPRHIEVILEWGITVANLILEILLVIFDQIASPKKPKYAVIALLVSVLALLICMTELIYKGQKQNIRLRREGLRCWLHCPSSNNNPYNFLDVFSLVSAISQIILSSIAYTYFCRGAQNPIKVCFIPVIFIICMTFSKLAMKPNETSLIPITRDV